MDYALMLVLNQLTICSDNSPKVKILSNFYELNSKNRNIVNFFGCSFSQQVSPNVRLFILQIPKITRYFTYHPLAKRIFIDSEANLPENSRFCICPNSSSFSMFIVLGVYNFDTTVYVPFSSDFCKSLQSIIKERC